jgi:hypothetical protein
LEKIWKHIQSWFGQADESSANNPYLHEVLKRDGAWLESYKSWLKTPELEDVIAWVHGQWVLFHDNMEAMDEGIDFLQTPSSKGLVLYFRRWENPPTDPLYYLEFLKDQVLNLDYKVQVADIRVYLNNGNEERLERYYLKPRIKFSEHKKSDQKFGNILLEVLFRKEQAFFLKLQATRYNGHEFSKGYEFDELVKSIF